MSANHAHWIRLEHCLINLENTTHIEHSLAGTIFYFSGGGSHLYSGKANVNHIIKMANETPAQPMSCFLEGLPQCGLLNVSRIACIAETENIAIIFTNGRVVYCRGTFKDPGVPDWLLDIYNSALDGR